MFISKRKYDSAIEESYKSGIQDASKNEVTTSTFPIYVVNYEVQYVTDNELGQIKTISRVFKYDDINEAFDDMESLWDHNLFVFTRNSLQKEKNPNNTVIGGYFESKIKDENIICRDIWLEIE
jgi:hypothetical protein